MNEVVPWLVVFDLDGTLIDSSLDLCIAVNAAMVYVGASELPHRTIAGFIGDGATTLIRRALCAATGTESPEQERFDAAFQHFLQFYREHKLDNTVVYEGVLSALRVIRGSRPYLPMAVLTNKPVGPSRDLCQSLGLEVYMFANYGGDSFDTKKPDPSGLEALISEARLLLRGDTESTVELPVSGVVMVGDSDVDVLTARNAGARSLGCLYGLAPQALLSAQPDMLCTSPQEWPALLGMAP